MFAMFARGSTVGSVIGGIRAIGDLALSAPVSGMSVNVGTGECLVPGSSTATQGGYYGLVSSTTNLVVAASNPSNPRVDLVCATITDSQYAGASNTFIVQVVTGTPSSGATLTNLTGAPALPASSLLLGYVLVPANSTNVTAGNLANKAQLLTSAGAVIGKTVFGSNNGSDYSTTSGSFAAIDSTNLSITLPGLLAATVAPLEIGFDFHYISNASAVGTIDFTCDGTEIDTKEFVLQYPPANLNVQHHAIVFRTASSAIAAGSHTFLPRFLLTSGTAFYIANGGSGPVSPCSFWVRQIPEVA